MCITATSIFCRKVIDQLRTPVLVNYAIQEESGKVIDKALGRVNIVRLDDRLQVNGIAPALAREDAPCQQVIDIIQARHPGTTIQPERTYLVTRPTGHIGR